MQIENLTENNIGSLEKVIKDLKKDNPDIKHRVFPMQDLEEKKKELYEKIELKAIIDRLESLEISISNIFGSHVLVQCQWVDINNLKGVKNA